MFFDCNINTIEKHNFFFDCIINRKGSNDIIDKKIFICYSNIHLD